MTSNTTLYDYMAEQRVLGHGDPLASVPHQTCTRPGNKICGHPSQIDQSGVGLTT